MTAGEDDAFPTLTIDLGASTDVGSVRLYRAAAPGGPAAYTVFVGDVAPPSGPQLAPLPQLARVACYTEKATAHGPVVDMPCAARGRYVTLQLTYSQDSVLRVCQLQAFG